MRVASLPTALLVVAGLRGLVAADEDRDGDRDVVVESEWEIRVSTILQGRRDSVPYSGLLIGFEHRADGLLWGGIAIGTMANRELDADRMPLPLQLATFATATGHLELAKSRVEDDFQLSAEAWGDFGTAYVRYAGRTAMPVIGSLGLAGRCGSPRTTAILSLGWGFAFAGDHVGIPLGGVDVRLGVTRRW